MKRLLAVFLILGLVMGSCFAQSTIGLRSSIIEIGPEFAIEAPHFGISASVGLPLQWYGVAFIGGSLPEEGEPFNPLELLSIISYRMSMYWKALDRENLTLSLGLVANGFSLLNTKPEVDEFLLYANYTIGPMLRVLFKESNNQNSGFFLEASAPFLGILIGKAENSRVPWLFNYYSADDEDASGALLSILSVLGFYCECVNFGYTWSF